LVKVEGDKLVCTCYGFKERGICSHVIAVSTIRRLNLEGGYLSEALRARAERELKLMYKQMRRA
jgi:hypothetical protein